MSFHFPSEWSFVKWRYSSNGFNKLTRALVLVAMSDVDFDSPLLNCDVILVKNVLLSLLMND